jgi:hypothetical protein
LVWATNAHGANHTDFYVLAALGYGVLLKDRQFSSISGLILSVVKNIDQQAPSGNPEDSLTN